MFKKIDLPVLQNRVFKFQEDAINSPKGFINLKQNDDTGIIENILFDNELIQYNQNYDNEQSNSATFKNHLEEVVDIISPFCFNKKIIEVGCGQGYFLNLLEMKGFDVKGYDPVYNGNNKNIIKEFFTRELKIEGDFIILRHVLEHIENPINFICEIANANNNKGMILTHKH